jgi:hypothetical protein
MDLESRVASIRTRADLADFVDALTDDLQVNGEDWGHLTLEGFLGVLAGSIRVLDRIYKNEGKELSEDHQWAVFAEMLLAARIRE